VFFIDAAHFVMGSFLGWVWCLTRYFLRAASGRQRYNVLGALNAVTLQVTTLTNTTYINAVSVCELLSRLATETAGPITAVMDNARYQRCQLVQETARTLGIELLFLPSYSPNLNLIERLWKFVKKQVLNSRQHQDFQRFRDTIDQCLARLSTQYRPHMLSLLTWNFQSWNKVSL
jgi:transposase